MLREPLTHFLVMGAVIFFAAAGAKSFQRPVLQIDGAELGQLAAYWEAQMQRPPSKQELQGLVRERIDEEILAREAIRLGLDRDDMIVRRRLAQKMAFASEDVGVIAEPDEAALRAFYARTRTAYASPARAALRHVFFSEDRPSGDAEAAAGLAVARLRLGIDAAGDPFVLQRAYADVAPAELARDYGPEFTRLVETAPVGTWQGPVRSPFGWHAVRVEARHPAEVPPFEVVSAEVREAWLADRRQAANAANMDRLRRRYRIVVADEAIAAPAHD